ncbi:RagB/SusD family nutrient uptake outer membrane protein [Bacteroidota bacterium]
MNKIVALILTGLILLLAGCEWLELLPRDGLVVDEYWKKKEDVEATLMGAYQQFALMDEKLWLYGEIRADMIEAVLAPGYQQQVMSSNIYSNNALCDWADFYKIINYCNNVINLAPEVRSVDNTFTEFQMVSYQSEAVFLRSLAYFYLVRIFGDVPYNIIPTTSDEIDFFIYKSSGDSVLTEVKKDLIKYRLTSPTEYGTLSENKGRATQSAMNALLADICMWNFEYEEAITYIEDIENSGLFFLNPTPEYIDIYNPGNSLESIFELQFDGVEQVNSMYDYTYNQFYYTSSSQAVELLSPEEADEFTRGKISFSTENTGYRIWKYVTAAADQRTVRPQAKARSCNFIIYRLSDILLLKAEAHSQIGEYSEAHQIISLIRARALVAQEELPGSAEALEDVIMEERAKELAFEGKRWFDLMRLGRRNNYARKNEVIEVAIRNAPSTLKLVLASKLSNPQGWYLPIYEDELERNLNLVQNPYYDIEL